MDEREFIDLIDCRFPYHDPVEAVRLAELACGISPNAAFTVVHELARPPADEDIPAEARLHVLGQLDACRSHPLKPLVLLIARRTILGDGLTLEEACTAMRAVAAHPDQYQALNVVYFAGADAWMEVDQLYEEIVREWHPV